MNYKEFRLKLGKDYNIGDVVWVCDYRFENISRNAIRSIKPLEVFIVSNNNCPGINFQNHIDIHFRPVGEDKKPVSRIISPYDKSSLPLSLNIFTSEEECRECYREQCSDIITRVDDEIKNLNNIKGLILDCTC